MKKTIIALMVLTGVAQAATVITFGGLASPENYGYVTDKYEIASVWQVNDITSVTDTLSDGTSFSLTNIDGGNNVSNFWGGSADGKVAGSWNNASALEEINSAMGTSYTANDLSAGGGMYFTAPGNGGSKSTLTFNFSAAAGDTITMYVMATAYNGTMSSFGVTGLENVSVAYATNGGSGFSTTAAYSDGAKNITVFKVTGTLTDANVALAPIGDKSGFQSVAYQIVPEPTTTTLSLLALAGLAARRRRK